MIGAMPSCRDGANRISTTPSKGSCSRLLLSELQRVGLIILRFQNPLTEGLEARRLDGIATKSEMRQERSLARGPQADVPPPL